MRRQRRAVCGLIALLAFGSALPLAAHDLVLRIESVPPAIIVRASYSGQDPVAGGSVEIFSPLKPDVRFQRGVSDGNGVFSFVPDVPGAWRVVFDDDFGHLVEKEVSVSDEMLQGEAATLESPQPTYQKLITGLGFIVGVTGLLLWVRARQVLRQAGQP